MKIYTFLKTNYFRKFLKQTEGVAAIEFALVAPIYILLISGIFVIGIWLFANVALTAAVNEAALKIMMGHPDTIQSNSYYTQYIRNALEKYTNNGIPKQNSSQYMNKTITYSVDQTGFEFVENSPVLVTVTVRYAFPCPVPLVSTKTFRFSFTGYAAVVGLTQK